MYKNSLCANIVVGIWKVAVKLCEKLSQPGGGCDPGHMCGIGLSCVLFR